MNSSFFATTVLLSDCFSWKKHGCISRFFSTNEPALNLRHKNINIRVSICWYFAIEMFRFWCFSLCQRIHQYCITHILLSYWESFRRTHLLLHFFKWDFHLRLLVCRAALFTISKFFDHVRIEKRVRVKKRARKLSNQLIPQKLIYT